MASDSDAVKPLSECYRNSSHEDRRRFHVSAAVTLLAGAANGYNLSCLDVKALNLPPEMIGLITSAPYIGVIIASVFCGYIADVYGRRVAAIFGESILVCGILFSAQSQSAHMLQTGQLITGLGIGFCSVAKPLYVCEKSPEWARAFMMTAWTFCYNIGIIGADITRFSFGSNWRAQLLCGAVPALCMVALFASSWADETAVWLALNGKGKEADRLEDGERAQQSKTNAAGDENGSDGSPGHLCSILCDKAFVLGFAAISIVTFPATVPGFVLIMTDVGLTLDALGVASTPTMELKLSMMTGVASLVGVFTATQFVASLSSRRIEISAVLACAVFLLFMGTAAHLQSHNLGFASLLLYLTAFNFGPANIFWVLLGEVFSNEHRALGMAVGVGFYHAVMSLMAYAYDPMLSGIGLPASCVVWVLINIFCLTVFAAFVTTTRFPSIIRGSKLA